MTTTASIRETEGVRHTTQKIDAWDYDLHCNIEVVSKFNGATHDHNVFAQVESFTMHRVPAWTIKDGELVEVKRDETFVLDESFPAAFRTLLDAIANDLVADYERDILDRVF